MLPHFLKIGVAKWDNEECLESGDLDSPSSSQSVK